MVLGLKMFAMAQRRWRSHLRWGRPDEADELQAEHGREAALQVVREKLMTADRKKRRQLYKLHDQIARRLGRPRLAVH